MSPSGSKQIALPSLPDAPEDPSDGLFEAGLSSKEKRPPGLHDSFHAADRSPPSLTIKNKALAVMQVPCFVLFHDDATFFTTTSLDRSRLPDRFRYS